MEYSKLIVILAVILFALQTDGHWWGRRRRRRRRIPPPPPEPYCIVSAWSAWTPCSKKCDFGTQERTRVITHRPSTFCRTPNLKRERDCGYHNGGCEETCNPTTGRCSCLPGHSLLSDQKRCQDDNECIPNGGRGPCSHTCINTQGSFKCRCPNGFYLHTDRKTCLARDCGTPSLPYCLAPVYADQLGFACLKVTPTCSSGTRLNAKCQFGCPTNYAVAHINDFSLPFAREPGDFTNVVTTTTCNLGSSGPVWSNIANFGHYFCRRTNDPPTDILLSKVTIKEHSKPGTTVGVLSAVSPPNVDTITFSVQQSAGHYFFQTQGNKLVNTWVPRWNNLQGLQINKYHVIIRATDNGNPPMSLDKNFTISVVNVNDPPYSVRISNNSVMDTATLNHVVGVLSAIDYDGPRGKLRSSDFVWKLIDNDRGRFRLQGANVVVAAALDHTAHQYHRIIVNCTDKDPTDPRWVRTTIVINVINTNDSPKNIVFKPTKLYENATNGFIAGEFIATDDDGDSVIFSLSKSDSGTLQTFNLGATTCINKTINSVRHSECKASLLLMKSVDYETKDSYSIKITATDPSGGFTVGDFLIHVINLNEAPTAITISKDTVPENSPSGTVVGQLTVTDPDTSQRSPQGHVCAVHPAAPFTLNGLNLIVSTAGTLNFESKATYRINITCTDTGVPPLSLWKEFNIKVQDRNERPEYLTLTRSSIQENARIGSPVGKFLSRDPDVNTRSLTFLVKSPVNSPFGIGGPSNDDLVTTKLLDYETMKQLDILVSVTDDGGLSLEKFFTIKILDVNEAPTSIILAPQTLPENSPAGTRIGSIEVIDPDLNSTASCRIVEGSTEYFAVSGRYFVAGQKEVDYEALGSTKNLDVKLKCIDEFGLFFERRFHITITDVNEPPTALELTLHTVPENQISADIGQVTVQDPDRNQGHSCKVIVNGAVSSIFMVDKATLKLKTRRPLNFEQQRRYPITVQCMDEPAVNQTQFTIFKDATVDVRDINENPLNPCTQVIYVDEAASNGSAIWTFHPRDPDNEKYETAKRLGLKLPHPKQHLVPSLASSVGPLPFTIADEQYLVKVGTLNRLKQDSYTVPVNVTDDGWLLRLRNGNYETYKGHSISVIYNCRVRVLATGDHRLKLDIALSSNTIPEDAQNGTKIGTLSILHGKPGAVYRLRIMNLEEAPFRLAGNDLILVTGVPLDYETTNATGVGIIAVDASGNTVQRMFLIKITNVNERPIKMCLVGNTTILELQKPDQVIGQLLIEDPDHKESTGICTKRSPSLTYSQNYTCEIESNFIDVSSLKLDFYVDKKLKLHSNVTFNYAAKKQYIVPIICRDIHKPIHLIELTVTIKIKEDTTAANWGVALSSNTVSEDAPNGTEIGTLSVINGRSDSYSFKVSDSRMPFRVAETKLILVIGQPLDYESTNTTHVIIVSTNSKQVSVMKAFTIKITNVNERPLKICLRNALSTIPEKMPVNSVIGEIAIEDPDHPNTKDICKKATGRTPIDHSYTCEIFSSSINVNSIKAKFYIDQQFRLNRKVDFHYLTKNSYNVPVLCRDKLKPIHVIENTFVIKIQAPSCQAGFKWVNGLCVCANGYIGPKCDRDPTICLNSICAKNDVCVSHINVSSRCIPRANQVPVLLQLPYTISSQLANKYKIESYVETIFEGRRPAGQTINTLFSNNVVNRRRRDIQKDKTPKDVYNELATAQKVKSFHTFVIFVAMDPNKGYLALLGSNMCALLKGTDIRCVNEEDCKLMAEVGIDCPYKFGNGGTGTGSGSGSGSGSGNGANKGKSTGKKDESSAPQPWIYGVSSVFVIAIVVIVLAIFVLRRRRTKRKSDQAVSFNTLQDPASYGFENQTYGTSPTPTPEDSPQNLPRKRDSESMLINNLRSQIAKKTPANVKTFENPMYRDPSRMGNRNDLNNPAYDAMSNLPPPDAFADEHIYESVGRKLGKETVNALVAEEKKREHEKGLYKDVVAIPQGKKGKWESEKGFLSDIVEIPKGKNRKWEEAPGYASIDEKQDNRKVVNIDKKKDDDSKC